MGVYMHTHRHTNDKWEKLGICMTFSGGKTMDPFDSLLILSTIARTNFRLPCNADTI